MIDLLGKIGRFLAALMLILLGLAGFGVQLDFLPDKTFPFLFLTSGALLLFAINKK